MQGDLSPPVKPNDFRRIALGMTGAVEASHMDHPDFRVHGRVFATLDRDGKRGMVKLTPEEQQAFVDASPSAFEPASGAWGRQGCTMVRLDSVDEGTLGEAMTLAWQAAVRAPVGRRPSQRRAAGKARKRKR